MSAARNTLPLLYDLSEAAVQLGTSERWLAGKLRAGDFPGRKLKRTWKLSPDDLVEIVRLCGVGPEPAPLADAVNHAVPQTSSMTRTTARRMSRGDR